MKYRKTVLMPIEVPPGEFCWGNNLICQYFNNEGGHKECELGFEPLERNGRGEILKPKKCLNLKER